MRALLNAPFPLQTQGNGRSNLAYPTPTKRFMRFRESIPETGLVRFRESSPERSRSPANAREREIGKKCMQAAAAEGAGGRRSRRRALGERPSGASLGPRARIPEPISGDAPAPSKHDLSENDRIGGRGGGSRRGWLESRLHYIIYIDTGGGGRGGGARASSRLDMKS